MNLMIKYYYGLFYWTYLKNEGNYNFLEEYN